MSKIVILGASGFVGSALSESLSNEGHQLVLVSRSSRPGYHQFTDIDSLPDAGLVIHLAEESDRSKVAGLGDIYSKESSLTVDRLISKYQGRIIYASSAVVYGDTNHEACTEQYNVEPTDLYSQIKIRNERNVVKAGGIALRFSNIYGKGMSDKNVISDILKQLNSNEPLCLRDVSPIRDFIDIQSVCTLIVSAVSSFKPGLYNVGSGVPISIKSLAQEILSIVDRSERPIISTNGSSRTSINYLDISKAKDVFNWLPNNDFNSNISDLIKRN